MTLHQASGRWKRGLALALVTAACWATLPISFIVIGSMLTATPISAFMAKHGRTAGFVFGALGGAFGAAIGAVALSYQGAAGGWAGCRWSTSSTGRSPGRPARAP